MSANDFKVLFLYPNLMLQTMFPQAITTFSSLLKERGYRVDIFDTTFYETEEKSSDEHRIDNLQVKPYDVKKHRQVLKPLADMIPDLRAKVEEFQPDLIAVSALEDTFPLGVVLLKAIEDYGIPNLVGGVFPTFAPEKALREEVVKMICLGEGEGALLDLCEALSMGKDHTRIQNLWLKDKEGRIIANPLRETIPLDTLPVPDFSLFDPNRFYKPMKGRLMRMGSVETHRGCPYKCTFCNSPGQVQLYKSASAGEFFRLKSIKKVHEEIKNLVDNFHVEYIHFPADTFLAMPDDHLRRFAEMYSEFRLPFWCQTRPETLTTERIRILERMGCRDMSIGIEHGNEKFRTEVVKRPYTNELLVKCFSLLEGTTIRVSTNNIVGMPMETRDLTWDTIRMNRAISRYLYSANAFHFVPYHGTPLRQLALKMGYITEETKLTCITKDTVLNMPQYTKEEIKGAVRTFTLYMRYPETEYPRIEGAERLDDDGNRLFADLQKEFTERFFSDDAVSIHA
ncbi:MAG: B12-binding domain-containing radical SAM protein [Candidatus Omnitrophica bacterium]|nr:B12-binding domain-containing radical SAM protein [Candidatus Omnitrophota bacterium]